MSSTIQINSDHTRVEVHLSGNITGKEVTSIYEEVASYPDCVSRIWNFLAANTINTTPAEIHHIAGQSRTLSINSKIQKQAIVGSSEKFHGLHELHHLFSDKWVGRPNSFISHTFASMNQACEWVHSDEK